MPNRDGTGPEGRGQMTGRGMGNCVTDTNEGDKPATTRARGLGFRKAQPRNRRGR